MTLTLSISDNQNGTGGVATIAGSQSAAMNVVWVQAVSGELGTGNWSPLASRTGDGAIGIDSAIGYYWAYCASTLSGSTTISNLCYFQLTQASDPVLYRCLLATQARIQSLALEGLSADNIFVQTVANDRNCAPSDSQLPCIQLSPVGREEMHAADATNLRDTVAYSILVAILAADNLDQTSGFSQKLTWRQAIARAFRNQPLPGVDEVFQCEVSPEEVVSAEAFFRRNLLLSALTLRFMTREPRGIAT